MQNLPENHPVQENMRDILQGTKRARDLVKQILAFSNQRDLEHKPLALQNIITETLKLLRSIIPSNILIEKNLPEPVVPGTGECKPGDAVGKNRQRRPVMVQGGGHNIDQSS